MLRLIAVLLAAATIASLLAACGDEEETPPADSGIDGLVLIGPQCPVVTESSPCPDQPFQATIDIYDEDRSRRVTTVESGADGRFRVALAPGAYVIVPLPPNADSPLPFAGEQTVTVPPDQFLELTISYDTGIR